MLKKQCSNPALDSFAVANSNCTKSTLLVLVRTFGGDDLIAEVGTKSVKGKGRVLVVEIEDLYRLRERMDGGATKLTPVTILAVEIPYVMGKVMSVLETPLFSVSVSVSAVGARGRR